MKKKRYIALLLALAIIFTNFMNIRSAYADGNNIIVGVYGNNGAFYQSVSVPYSNGDTAFTVLSKCGLNIDATGRGETVYVAGINGLYEFDGGPKSGWVYAVNGYKPNVSSGVYSVMPGDKLVWHYTVDLGEDIYLGINKLNSFAATYKEPVKVPEENDKTETTDKSEENIKTEIQSGNKEESIDAADKNQPVRQETDENKDENKVAENETAEDEIDKSKDESEEITIDDSNKKDDILNRINNVIESNLKVFSVSPDSHWEALSLSLYGRDGFSKYIKNVIAEMEDRNYSFSKVTDLEKTILLLNSAGYDVTKINGNNLIKSLLTFENIEKQGANGIIFALIALNSINNEMVQAEITNASGYNKSTLAELLLSYQNEDGGFSLNKGEDSNTDLTAMALQALSVNSDIEGVSIAVDNAVKYLSGIDIETSESISQTIIALSYLNIDAGDFNGNNLIRGLMDYMKEDNSFSHVLDGESNGMATEQAVLALIAYEQYKEGKVNLYSNYDLNKVEVTAKADTYTYLLFIIPVVIVLIYIIYRWRRRNEKVN